MQRELTNSESSSPPPIDGKHTYHFTGFYLTPTWCRNDAEALDASELIINSSRLTKSLVKTRSLLGSACVILCTLEMLVDPLLRECHLMDTLAPPATVIFDDAAQVPLNTILPLLPSFEETLTRVICVGDDQQSKSSC